MVVLAIFRVGLATPQSQTLPTTPAYLGFDRNQYPGDANLGLLRQTFTFAGYWLNNPPGEKTNTWVGKRKLAEAAGFGFLVLYNGRLFSELKSTPRATKLARSDAEAAVAAAHREGFPQSTIIFLDQEQGGRMLPGQKAYIYGWVDGVVASGFHAGVYCSGIAFKESPDVSVITAVDIQQNAGNRKIAFFVTNDACPPSPGCSFLRNPPSPSQSGIDFADVWQFVQSPRRVDVSAACLATPDRDGNCYPPGVDARQSLHVDVDTATSADPSRGRGR